MKETSRVENTRSNSLGCPFTWEREDLIDSSILKAFSFGMVQAKL
jgi:hypothetical protein